MTSDYRKLLQHKINESMKMQVNDSGELVDISAGDVVDALEGSTLVAGFGCAGFEVIPAALAHAGGTLTGNQGIWFNMARIGQLGGLGTTATIHESIHHVPAVKTWWHQHLNPSHNDWFQPVVDRFRGPATQQPRSSGGRQ